ncbi:hypothetical protein BH09ACT1_BH09ACT1_28760 [soil metagenome]
MSTTDGSTNQPDDNGAKELYGDGELPGDADLSAPASAGETQHDSETDDDKLGELEDELPDGPGAENTPTEGQLP